MQFPKRSSYWTTVYCPLCKAELGKKKNDELKKLVCHSQDCSETEHWFYPGQHKRPGKSVPWADKIRKKKGCGCPNCSSD